MNDHLLTLNPPLAFTGCSRSTMMNFKSFVVASAALALCQGVGASVVRRWDTAGPSCTDFTPFVYAGCFSDPSSARALPFSSSDLNTQAMTVEICVAFCKGAKPPASFYL